MSRLLENSEGLREKIYSRNLYTPLNEYDINNDEVTKAVNNIASVISPLKSFDLSNTVIGRSIGENTPLAQYGLVALSTQLLATAKSNAIAEFAPSISFLNLFDGNPNTKLITTNKDFQITRRESQSNIGRLLEELSGVSDIRSPFDENSKNIDYLKNTGKGQLEILFGNINKNQYHQSDNTFITFANSNDLRVSDNVSFISNKIWFNSENNEYFSDYGAREANRGMKSSERDSLDTLNNKKYEYSQNNINFTELFGNTEKTIKSEPKKYDNRILGDGFDDNVNNQIVWGRDGKNNITTIENSTRFNSDVGDETSLREKFNVRKGLLKYTSELLNASEGKLIDQTRKKYFDPKNTNNFVGYNGSGMYEPPAGSLFEGETGIRQHTITDQYDRYAKAIRFDGNVVYNGNENSVIYNSVIPKIHPILDAESGLVDNRNMMFSIENLAINVIPDQENGVAYLDDDYSTVIPISEAGSFGGRIMWFPPYDLKISEQSISRHETTNMIGRGEPIYTYNNSERLANLSFKLLIDYPQQLLSFRGNDNFHKAASDFFVFGGGEIENFSNISQKEKRLKDLIEQKETFNNVQKTIYDDTITPVDVTFSFPNDYPDESQINNIFDLMVEIGYEDGIVDNSKDGTDYSTNKNIYDLTANSQYNFNDPNNTLNTYIQKFFIDNDPSNFQIVLEGNSSKLFTKENIGITEEEYNKQLSERRIDAVLELLNKRYQQAAKTSKSLEDEGLKIIKNINGSIKAEIDNATLGAVAERDTKLERSVTIKISRNDNVNFKENDLTPEELRTKNKLDSEIRTLSQKIKQERAQLAKANPYIFKRIKKEDNIRRGFAPTKDDIFYQTFHSQTPEDFHRRLTFLQQCLRQGQAIRRNVENGGISSSNSVFGRQPIQVLRVGDFFNTKIVIDNINIEYGESTWDLNPEGMGMQPMMADVTIQMRIIGGQSLKGPIDAIQNAVSFNYYANSTYYNTGTYATSALVEALQTGDKEGIKTLEDQKNRREVRRNDLISAEDKSNTTGER